MRQNVFFFSKKHFLAERKNSCFSVIPARTGSFVILGHFLMAQRCSPSFIENGSKLRVLIIAKPKRPKKGVSPEKWPIAQKGHWSFWARPCRLIWCPVCWLVGDCGVRAVSPKTPISFMIIDLLMCRLLGTPYQWELLGRWEGEKLSVDLFQSSKLRKSDFSFLFWKKMERLTVFVISLSLSPIIVWKKCLSFTSSNLPRLLLKVPSTQSADQSVTLWEGPRFRETVESVIE